jgi:hypothetical protein
VVAGGDSSEKKEIFSGAPQGAKWSPKLWNFDISEMQFWISDQAMLICYADDCGLWYPITTENRDTICDTINMDLEGLRLWGLDNKTKFEPSKTHFTLMSKKSSHKFVMSDLIMDGEVITQASEVKLVGYTFDEKMSWATMISGLASKARSRLGMLTRLRRVLDDENMKTMYCTFIRPMMEYGSVAFMGAKDTHLIKLDKIQSAAEKIGRFKVESLVSRREAAAVALTCKLLDGQGRGVLQSFAPPIANPDLKHCHDTSQARRSQGVQLVDQHKAGCLDLFRDSYFGKIHKIWAKLPQELISKGEKQGWRKIARQAKGYLTGTWVLHKTQTNKTKRDSDVIKDPFQIDGFHIDRINEYERESVTTRSNKVKCR